MQIFRVHPEHEISARYLDNRRLSKQVLELYQIIRVCLAEMKLIEGNTRYLHHPIVKHVYHEGQPYIMDTFKMLEASFSQQPHLQHLTDSEMFGLGFV